MVAAFSYSWKKKHDLAIAQEHNNLPIHQLKLDVVTRLGSVYDMVERVIEQIEVVKIVLGADKNSSHLIPSWQDCDAPQAVTAALKPLKERLMPISGKVSYHISCKATVKLSHYSSIGW